MLSLDDIPLRARLHSILHTHVLSNRCPRSDRVPSRDRLNTLFGIDHVAIHRTLNSLRGRKLVFGVRNGNAFITGPGAFRGIDALRNLTRSVANHNCRIVGHLHDFGFVTTSGLITRHLRITRKRAITRVGHIQLVGHRPVSLRVACLPRTVNRQLRGTSLIAHSVFLVLRGSYNLTLKRTSLTVSTILTSDSLARTLGIRTNSPVVHVRHLARSTSNHPISFRRLCCHNSTFRCHLQVSQRGKSRT